MNLVTQVLCTVVGIERMPINTIWIFKAAVNEAEFERNTQSEKKIGVRDMKMKSGIDSKTGCR